MKRRDFVSLVGTSVIAAPILEVAGRGWSCCRKGNFLFPPFLHIEPG